jgi:hypothetical protein
MSSTVIPDEQLKSLLLEAYFEGMHDSAIPDEWNEDEERSYSKYLISKGHEKVDEIIENMKNNG